MLMSTELIQRTHSWADGLCCGLSGSSSTYIRPLVCNSNSLTAHQPQPHPAAPHAQPHKAEIRQPGIAEGEQAAGLQHKGHGGGAMAALREEKRGAWGGRYLNLLLVGDG